MLGPKVYIKTKEVGITLVPLIKEDAKSFADMKSSLIVNAYTSGPYGVSIEDEEDAYNSMRQNRTSVIWHIIPDGENKPIGYTALYGISYNGSCNSEIMIFDQKWWNKGSASQAHIARTWYAAEYLNRNIIHSSVHSENVASLKALEKIGYFRTGIRLKEYYREGKYADGVLLAWINPNRVFSLYPDGLPDEYKEHVEKAKELLALAYEEVKSL